MTLDESLRREGRHELSEQERFVARKRVERLGPSEAYLAPGDIVRVHNCSGMGAFDGVVVRVAPLKVVDKPSKWDMIDITGCVKCFVELVETDARRSPKQ